MTSYSSDIGSIHSSSPSPSPSCFSTTSSISSLNSSPELNHQTYKQTTSISISTLLNHGRCADDASFDALEKFEIPETKTQLNSTTATTTTANTTHNQQSVSTNKLSECKSLFVEALVDAATLLIESMWSCSTTSSCYIQQSVSLKRFVQETLRRSRTSYSTLQLALYYLVLIKPYIFAAREEQKLSKGSGPIALACGRRTFLAALMLASKYSQDRNYSVAAWSKISGLPTNELCENEVKFLDAVKWNLFVGYDIYERWSQVLFECACDPSGVTPVPSATNSTSSVHAQDLHKRSIWIERFRTININITNCDWLNKVAVTSVPSTNSDDLVSEVDAVSPDLTPKTQSYCRPSLAKAKLSSSTESQTSIIKPVVNCGRINKLSPIHSQRRQLKTPAIPKRSDRFRAEQNLAVYTLLSGDNGAEQVIINNSAAMSTNSPNYLQAILL